jgi:hypothetical protein
MKSLSAAARCVLLAREPKAMQSAVKMALFPPAPARRGESHHTDAGERKGEREGGARV